MAKLTDEQIYYYLIEELHKSYNLNQMVFRMEIGIRHKAPFDQSFWAVMCSTDGRTFIEYSEVPESVFLRLCPPATFRSSRRERGWDFIWSKDYSRTEIEDLFRKQTRQAIIADLLLDIENEVA